MPLAHAGGWDEILFLLLPAVVFFFVLQLRRKHVEAQNGAGDEAEDDPTKDPSGR
ncbi:MAG: hypothetical protein WEB06_09090 [Actinomycetota bacterium]